MYSYYLQAQRDDGKFFYLRHVPNKYAFKRYRLLWFIDGLKSNTFTFWTASPRNVTLQNDDFTPVLIHTPKSSALKSSRSSSFDKSIRNAILLEQPIGCSVHILFSCAWSNILTASPTVKLTGPSQYTGIAVFPSKHIPGAPLITPYNQNIWS